MRYILLVACLLCISSSLFAQNEKQKVIKPGSDNSISLHAVTAKISGTEIAYMPEWKALGWFRNDGVAEWHVAVKKAGKYDVFLEWSVSDEEAGKGFVLLAGSQKLTGKVEKSGSWETFKKVKIGEMNLKKGVTHFVFKPEINFGAGALLDLREIVLVPVKK
jgi:hypothetical protein